MRHAPVVVVAFCALAQPWDAGAETPLTLDEAVRMARSHHPTVEAQTAQTVATEGRREQSLAALLPFLTGAFAYQPTTPNFVVTPALGRSVLSNVGNATVVDAAGNPVVVTCRNPGQGNCTPVGRPGNSWELKSFWLAQLGLSWTVWDWGRSLYGYQSSRDLSGAATIGVRTAQRNVVLGVKLAFFGVLAADDQVAVAEDAVTTFDARLTQVRALHQSGLRTGIDVATAESALATVTTQLARARAMREAARAQLVAALGEDHWRDWKLVAHPASFELQPIDKQRTASPLRELSELALAQRTELQQLQLQERGLEAAVSSTRGAWLPGLTLTIGPTWAGTELGSLTPNLTLGIAVGYGGGLSPFLVQGSTREAQGNLLATRAQQRSTRIAIHQETMTARGLLAAAADELRSAATLVESAARQRSFAEGRYQTGVGDVIELYNALFNDVSARSLLVQARLDLASARAQLQHALGEED